MARAEASGLEAKLDKQSAIARALRIKELANGDGGLFAIFDEVERRYTDNLYTTDPTDTALREAIYHRANALRDLRDVMKAIIARGASEETKIRRLSEVKRAVA